MGDSYRSIQLGLPPEPESPKPEGFSIPMSPAPKGPPKIDNSLPDGMRRVTIRSDGQTSYEHQPQGFHQTAPPAGSGILATARNRTGSPIMDPSRITDDSILTHNGMEATAESWARMGVLTRGMDGRYSVPQASHQDQQQPTQGRPQEQPEEDPAAEYAFDEDTERELGSYIGQPSMDTIHAISELVDTGSLSQETASRLAGREDPSAIIAKGQQFWNTFATQAGEVVSAVGADPVEFREWAEANHKGRLRDAIMDHVHRRDVSGYQRLAKEFVANLDKINPDRILQAEFAHGITASMDSSGRVILRAPNGQQVEWRSAIRNGWVNLGG